jgi:sarcosine oxidase gamma subunit
MTPKHTDVDDRIRVHREAAANESLRAKTVPPRRRGREPRDHDAAVRTVAPDRWRRASR